MSFALFTLRFYLTLIPMTFGNDSLFITNTIIS